MLTVNRLGRVDTPLTLAISFLTVLSIIILRSIAPSLFPSYYFYIIIGIICYLLFSKIDFDVMSIFSKHFYIFSIVLLVITLILGQVTRGAVRWIPLAGLTFQTAELVRPLLIIFFANYVTSSELSVKKFFKAILLLSLPVFLIIIQPSLGVAVLTLVSFVGVLIAGDYNKKILLIGILLSLILIPASYFALAPYQRLRIETFLNPNSDPLGAGYNSIQSMISVGSGKILGRGLGKGVQTQLSFLPERHSDFVFASISEELGFVGSTLTLLIFCFLLFRITKLMEGAPTPQARAYLSGVFLVLFTQGIINIGMNIGLLPITGLPLPLVSAGGSSYLATMSMLGIALGAKSRS